MTVWILVYVTEVEKDDGQVMCDKQKMTEKQISSTACKDLSQQGSAEELAPSCP